MQADDGLHETDDGEDAGSIAVEHGRDGNVVLERVLAVSECCCVMSMRIDLRAWCRWM